MEWKTSISHITEKEEHIRGYKLEELIGRLSFTETIWLVLQGELPSSVQTRILDAILVSMIEHGIGTPSAMTARIIGSCSPSLTTAAGGSLLTIGEYHGGAISAAAAMVQEAVAKGENAQDVVMRFRDQKKRVPGFGHRVLTHDPRAEKLEQIAIECGVAGAHVTCMKEIGAALNEQSSKPLPLNIDGMTAGILSDLGFDPRMANGFFAIARLPGLVAHIAEEQAREKPLRRLSLEECVYDGVAPRQLYE
ncbi:MAG: citryl-CoA lyase [Candidatus Sungbacteria bacterium]|nr:citryl-CoA lyase [bacterium]MDZ4285447.1 citryl-CoA lyase [Candidatus Sungbacteria bacterium]